MKEPKVSMRPHTSSVGMISGSGVLVVEVSRIVAVVVAVVVVMLGLVVDVVVAVAMEVIIGVVVWVAMVVITNVLVRHEVYPAPGHRLGELQISTSAAFPAGVA